MSKEMTKREAVFWTVVGTIRGAIQEAGEEGIPSGHLYAMLMDKMSLGSYQGIIDLLKKKGMITENNHLLKAVSA